MPVYVYLCQECGFENEGIYPIMTPKVLPCPECCEEGAFVKQITSANFSIKGGNAKNGYYTPPTNEQIGLPAERELRKRLDSPYWAENTKKGGFLNEQEKELVDLTKKVENAKRREREKKISELSDKYKPEAAKIKNAIEKTKKQTREQRQASKERRKKRGDYGVKKSDQKIIVK